MRLTLSLLLALLAPALSFGAQAAGKADAYQVALNLYLRGDFQEALNKAEDGLSSKARRWQFLALRARVWHVLGEYGRMQTDARRVLAEAPTGGTEPSQFLARGDAALLLGRAEDALVAYSAALKWDAESLEGLAGRARALRALGKTDKALVDFDELLTRAPKTPVYLLQRALARFDRGEIDAAIADLTSLLRVNTRVPAAFGLLGASFARKGDLARALSAYNKANELEPHYIYPYIGRAALRLARQEEEAAWKEFDEAAKINVRDYSIYFNRGEARWRRGDRQEALADFRKSLEGDLPDAGAAIAVGDRFADILLWKDALAAYTRAREISPGAAPLLKRARIHEAMEAPKPALKDLSEAVDAEPGSVEALTARGLLQLRLGMDEEALSDLNRAFKLEPKNPELLIARAAYMARTRKPNAALDDYNAAIAASPDLAEAYNNRGALYANSFGDHEKALKDIEKAISLKPEDPGFHFNLGVVRLKTMDFLAAMAAFEQSLQLKGPAARVHQYRAETHSWMGNHAKALEDIQVALEKDPENAGVYETLGLIRLRRHDYEQAIIDLTQAVKLDARSVGAFLRRGQAHAALKEYKPALSDFRRAASLDHASKEALVSLCWVKRLMDEPAAALRDCEKAIDLDPGYGPAYLHRGLAYLRKEEFFKAVESLDDAARLGERPAESRLALALAHAGLKQLKLSHQAYMEAVWLDPEARAAEIYFGPESGKPDAFYSAVMDMDSELSEDPSDPYSYIVRADALHNAGLYDRAVMEYTKAMEVDGTLSAAYVGRGTALVAQDSLDPAHQDFIRAVELDPKDSGAQLRLAVLLTSKKKYKEAVERATAALLLNPSGSEAYFRAGNAYFFLKDPKRAVANYELAVKAEPTNPVLHNGLGMGYLALKKPQDSLQSFSRAIALHSRSAKYHRNRGSAYTSLRDFNNAAVEFKNASVVNTDPGLVEEFNTLIQKSEEAQSTTRKSS